MRCSTCSKPIKPIAAIDIDGTLGDYHVHLVRFATDYLGHEQRSTVRPYTGFGPFREWFTDAFDIDTRTFRDIKLAYRQGAQKRSMPVRPWARDLIKTLRAAGTEIWLTTTRPYMRLDNVDPDTRFWLRRHGLKYDYLMYDDHKYELLSQQIDRDRVAFVLDDLEEMLDEAGRYFGVDRCLLYATSWNTAAHDRWNTVDSENVVQTTERVVSRWRDAH